MVYSFIVTIALAMGLMLSSESLGLLGNNIGIAGIPFFASILIAVIVHVSTALRYGELFAMFPGAKGEAQFMQKALGSVPAIVFPLCSRVVITVCASTGMLATAGFVFNEVFIYWFPNFAFAFLLLGFLLVINLLGNRVSQKFQVFFVIVALSGLIFLSIAGLLGLENAPSTIKKVTPSLNIRIVLISLFLFIGFDLAGFAQGKNSPYPAGIVKPMVTGIILICLLFYLWGLVSIIYVQQDRLADTTIPYTLTAREIMGQDGRVVIGMVVLAGICSAVNALFIAVSKMIAGMATLGLLPHFLGVCEKRAAIPLILLVTGIAVMIAVGMAGEPVLEVYLRAGLLFWLLNYTGVHLSALIVGISYPNRSQSFRVPLVSVVAIIILSVGFVVLLCTDSESTLLLQFMLVVSVIVSFFGFIWVGLNRKKNLSVSR
ncbi:MAG: amino acid permease [Thermodesulfobacteriota bacterium]|nr:amino acid permease [Thermodesulfobacteriota bacterium]